MAISNMEKNVLLDLSSNSHHFFKSTYLHPRVVFSQYVLRQFLNLYFVNMSDLKALDAYFKILYFKNIINSLMMISHYISLLEIEAQKQGIEKKYQDLLFKSKQETFVSSYVKEDISWIDETLAIANQKIDDSIDGIVKKLKVPKKTVEKKVEKLFDRFQEILSVSIYSFQKSTKESHHGELDMNQFKKQIDYHLKQHLHLNDSNFLYEYGLTIAGCAFLFAAIGILFYPNIILSLGGSVLITQISLGLIGALSIFLNQYYPNLREEYTNFLQI
jgi:hypothetical protein